MGREEKSPRELGEEIGEYEGKQIEEKFTTQGLGGVWVIYTVFWKPWIEQRSFLIPLEL
jgi:hypothetical protein